MGNEKVRNRQKEILELLSDKGTVYLEELLEHFGCSEATIRNDLRLMDEQGLLKRIFGGATRVPVLSISTRATSFKQQKIAIADYVMAHYITPNSIITLDSGSTVIELANKIVASQIPVSVITTSFYAAAILHECESVKLTLVGGKYNSITGCFFDENTISVLKTMRSDFYFMGARGIDDEAGITISNDDEATLKRTMIKCAGKTVALMDSSKFGLIGFKVVCMPKDIDAVVTDENVDPGVAMKIRKSGPNVCIAGGCRQESELS